MTPKSLGDPHAARRLETLSSHELKALHERGTCPDPGDLGGVMSGVVLASAVPRRLQPWRGKVLEQRASGEVIGLNRIAVGPTEILRYRFTATRARSAFGERDVVLLDHGTSTNPVWIRRFHDELVQIEPGLFLATSHYQAAGRLRLVAFFTLTPI